MDVCKVGRDDGMPWQVMGQWKKMAAVEGGLQGWCALEHVQGSCSDMNYGWGVLNTREDLGQKSN